MGLENHPVAKKSWTIHLTHSIWNMQRENSLYIYMYIHVLNRKKQRLFYSWFWLMLLVSPTKIHVPCHGEKFWDADRPRSGRLNTGAHWCSIVAAREGLKWFLVLTACWLVIVVYSWKTSFTRLPKQLVKHRGAEHGIPPGKSTSGCIMLIHVQPQTWDLVNLVL